MRTMLLILSALFLASGANIAYAHSDLWKFKENNNRLIAIQQESIILVATMLNNRSL